MLINHISILDKSAPENKMRIQLEIKISLLPSYFFGKVMTQMIENFMGRKRRIRFKLKTKKLTQRVQELLENKKL